MVLFSAFAFLGVWECNQPCAAPLFRLEAFGVPIVFREVLPPVEGRAAFFLRPRGTAPVVRLAVCCFWPAIAPGNCRRRGSDQATMLVLVCYM